MSHFPEGAPSFSFFFLLSLPTLAAFILLPLLWIPTTHRDSQRSQNTHKKRKRKHTKKTDALIHTHMHTHKGIYRHRGPYFRMLSAAGQRLQETQDGFSFASFHHTVMTPLFTSSIHLPADCLPPWHGCLCACMCV